mgnify:CR=1 FL=1
MTVLLQFIADNAAWIYGACALIALWYLRVVFRARRERKQAVFALEREAAVQRVYNALGIALALLATIGVTYFISNVLLEVMRPLAEEGIVFTPTIVLPTLSAQEIGSTPSPIPMPTPTQSLPTPRPRPTLRPLPTPPPELTSSPAPMVMAPNCPNPSARLVSPGQNQMIKGSVPIIGTANIPNMQYYKLEFRPAGSSADYSYIGGQNAPADGTLTVWNTAPLPDGVYTLRLVVVDHTGNYPPPCEVSVIITH